MRKIMICLIVLLTLVGCSTKKEEEKPVEVDIKNAVENPMKLAAIISEDEVQVMFNRLPESFLDIATPDRSVDEGNYLTAALLVASYTLWNKENPEDCYGALRILLNSPTVENGFTKNTKDFVKERMLQNNKYEFIGKAYFNGATPENGYTPDTPYVVTFRKIDEEPQESTIYGKTLLIERVAFKTAGADSERFVSFYRDPEDNNWYIWSDSYGSLLADIRQPQ